MALLATFSLEGLADFILRLYDEENEEQLWDVWLHRDTGKSFKDFKKENLKQVRQSKKQTLSKEEEQKIIQANMRFIKPVNKGGENKP